MRLNLDRAAKYRYAVLSMRLDGGNTVELESSFADQVEACRMFDNQYSKWGLTEQNFYLVDTQEQKLLKEHEVFTNEFTRFLMR